MGTENRDNFGEPKPASASSSTLLKAGAMRMAGTNPRAFEDQQVRRITNLMGENMVQENDAQERVDIQRQWLPQTDIAIHNVNNGKARLTQTNMFDNANSLPIGEGHKPAFQQYAADGGYYPRRGADVTQIPNQVITRK